MAILSELKMEIVRVLSPIKYKRKNESVTFCKCCNTSLSNISYYICNKLKISVATYITAKLSRTSLTSLVAQTVKRLPTMQEIRVRSLGREDPLEKEMAIHYAWKIPWTEEPGRLQSMGSQSPTRLSDFTLSIQGYRKIIRIKQNKYYK